MITCQQVKGYNHLNIIITDLVVNLENEEKYE